MKIAVENVSKYIDTDKMVFICKNYKILNIFKPNGVNIYKTRKSGRFYKVYVSIFPCNVITAQEITDKQAYQSMKLYGLDVDKMNSIIKEHFPGMPEIKEIK
jgi:hypothetical protein